MELYVEWLDQGPATLRELGVRELADPRAPSQPLPETVLLERSSDAQVRGQAERTLAVMQKRRAR